MKTRIALGLSLMALMVGGTMVGCAGGQRDLGTVSSRAVTRGEQQAQADAKAASRFLAAGQVDKAIAAAEAAVAAQPRNGDHRALLGQAYLKAGRFTSADQALTDALTLAPGNGRAALNLALAQIGEGQWDQARHTLEDHAATVAASDRGLALALAGDPGAGVEALTAAVRSPDATAKTRQNLALAFALAGRWEEARVTASVDMAPAEVDNRMIEWAAFAKPTGAADQVAALLGVVPIKDAGQPVALALNAPAPGQALAAITPATPAAEPVKQLTMVDTPAPAPAAAPVEAPAPMVAEAAPAPVLTAPRVYKAAMKFAVAAKAAPAAVSARALAKGDWYVQLGAFDNAAVARDAWGRAQRRFVGLRQQMPTGMNFTLNGATFYRLSVGGFARADADRVCRAYRAKGGACFIRAGAGDRMAQWVKPASAGGVQLAAR